MLCSLYLFGLTACSSNLDHKSVQIPAPAVSSQFHTESVTPPTITQLVSLSEQQRQEIHAFVSRPDIAALRPFRQVEAYVLQHVDGFGYKGVNLPATEALAQRQGNCMTLALMTYAVAQELDVHSRFQMVYTEPVLTDVRNGLAFISDHVRVFLYDAPVGTEGVGGFMTAYDRVAVDYFPDPFNRNGGLIDNQEFLAKFYRNLAADALALDEYNKAFYLVQEGFSLDADSDSLINLMAVLHRRVNEPELATQWYDYGIELGKADLTLLANYQLLASNLQDRSKADKLADMIASLPDKEPYDLYLMGRDALRKQEYHQALDYLTRFLNTSAYYYPAWAELAQAQHAVGQTAQAKRSMAEAIHRASNKEQGSYQAKLLWLKQKADLNKE
ncbi:hypothetical protein L2725_09455 [Shewanella corallii]|uniref:Tetratricopeptide repeat protein n=1 Tax=Shewanella corallii TaxID=560080 RepID=A0ABT0N6E9_9GAMM|nr:hypothetical protein [Shewanella corallii]MCL2914013.1 hypothetical protein [Shewanella corallii]